MSTELNQLDGDDEVPIRALGVHILEVYAPLRQAGTGQIVALVETYDVATELYYEVRAAQALVWLIFGASAIGFISLLVYPDWEGSKRDLAHQRREERVSNAGRAVPTGVSRT